MAKNLIIVYGGSSTEHDVSIVTALQIYRKYSMENMLVHLVYIDREDNWYMGEALNSFQFYRKKSLTNLKKVKLEIGSNILMHDKGVGRAKKLFQVDFAINCCHGGFGESGDLVSLFEMCKIPSSTGDSTSLKIAMDKYMTKLLSVSLDIPTVDFFVVAKREWHTIRASTSVRLIEPSAFAISARNVAICVRSASGIIALSSWQAVMICSFHAVSPCCLR